MDIEQKVLVAASAVKALDPSGALMRLDSLGLLDFLLSLEKTFDMSIPAAAVREDAFRSLDAVATLMRELTEDDE
jgi:acyl carrier protein